MDISRIRSQLPPSVVSKINPQPKPMPVAEAPPAMRQRYSEDPAIAAAIAEMNAYTGIGKKAKRF
jgi:hypothetical protein